MKLFIGKQEIIRVLESFGGDLYFISEQEEGDEILCYAWLYSMTEFAEWGWNLESNLKSAYGKHMLWDVPKDSWPNLSTYKVEGLTIVEKVA